MDAFDFRQFSELGPDGPEFLDHASSNYAGSMETQSPQYFRKSFRSEPPYSAQDTLGSKDGPWAPWNSRVSSSDIVQSAHRVISKLLCSGPTRTMYLAAMNDLSLRRDYPDLIRQLIVTLGQDLSREAQSLVEHDTALALQLWDASTRVLDEFVTRSSCETPEQSKEIEASVHNQKSGSSTRRPDGQEPAVSLDAINDDHIRHFVEGSKGYAKLRFTLAKYVRKPYEQKLLKALYDVNAAEEAGQSYGTYGPLARSVEEISWVPTKLVSFSDDRSMSIADNIKGFIEDSMNESWNWSPLEPRKHRLQAGWCRMSWRTPLGQIKHVDLPEHARAGVQHVLDFAPEFINLVDLDEVRVKAAAGRSSAGTTSGPGPTVPPPVQLAGSGTTPQIPLQSLGTAAPSTPPGSPGLSPQGSNATDNRIGHYLYLCVEAGSRHILGLDCENLVNDVQLFDKIKAEYNSARGWFRLRFSTWRYDHCEFFQFQKIGLNYVARLSVAFPEPTDTLYHFSPKPLDRSRLPPDGPIPPDEFNFHYYYQACPSLFSWERWHRRQISRSSVESQALEAAPKRLGELDMQNGQRERFYGLYAKEARSALRVVIHLILCCSPGVVFFFLWLYKWGHGADIQGAAVPVQLSLTLMIGYVGALYWTR